MDKIDKGQINYIYKLLESKGYPTLLPPDTLLILNNI